MTRVEGKTKIISPGPRDGTVILQTKDILTGGDAAKREVIEGISINKTTQAANVFSLLSRHGLPTAFIEQTSPDSLLCHDCEMLPLELVVRRYAWGSFLKRCPEYEPRNGNPHRFDDLKLEFYHKWAVVTQPLTDNPYMLDENRARERFLRDGVWQRGVYTDPYLELQDGRWMLFPAKEPRSGSRPLMEIDPVCSGEDYGIITGGIMTPAFLALEDAWSKVETVHGPVALVDFKIEVGRRALDGKLVIADVVDNDSWRIWPGADPKKQLDKQCFRDNSPLSEVAEKYALVARLTARFLESD